MRKSLKDVFQRVISIETSHASTVKSFGKGISLNLALCFFSKHYRKPNETEK
jgi:hypothetical protein